MKRTALRCYCSEAPLLAVCGIDEETGEPWVHVKSWKGGKLYTEVVITSGVVQLRCRSCGKWNRVKIVRGNARLQTESQQPFQTLEKISADNAGF